MTHKTKGIVIRTVKYGETSLIATVFTSLFGVQTYLINGVRKKTAKSSKAIMLQPGAILDMEVYHNELKSIQRIKEINWSYVYKDLLSDVIKNSILVYLLELLNKCLKQPEENSELFDFCEDALITLDEAEKNILSNFSLYFSLQLAHFFGFKIESPNPEIAHNDEIYFDLKEGYFSSAKTVHHHFIEGELAQTTIELLKAMHPHELHEIKLNREKRRLLLTAYQQYYSLHIQDFGNMKTWKILQELL